MHPWVCENAKSGRNAKIVLTSSWLGIKASQCPPASQRRFPAFMKLQKASRTSAGRGDKGLAGGRAEDSQMRVQCVYAAGLHLQLHQSCVQHSSASRRRAVNLGMQEGCHFATGTRGAYCVCTPLSRSEQPEEDILQMSASAIVKPLHNEPILYSQAE